MAWDCIKHLDLSMLYDINAGISTVYHINDYIFFGMHITYPLGVGLGDLNVSTGFFRVLDLDPLNP